MGYSKLISPEILSTLSATVNPMLHADPLPYLILYPEICLFLLNNEFCSQ